MTKKLFDVEATLERVDNDIELLEELVGICLSEKGGRCAAIRNAIVSQNPKLLDSEAHAIKSALGNVGAMTCHQLASELEQMGKRADLSNALATLEKLETEIELYETAFKSFKTAQ